MADRNIIDVPFDVFNSISPAPTSTPIDVPFDTFNSIPEVTPTPAPAPTPSDNIYNRVFPPFMGAEVRSHEQGIDDGLRLSIKNLINDPDNQVAYLEKQGFVAGRHPNLGVGVVGEDKGTKVFRPIDPPNIGAKETLKEIGDNLILAPAAMGKTPVGAGLAGFATEGARQFIESRMLKGTEQEGTAFDPTALGIETTASAIGPAGPAILKGTKNLAGKATTKTVDLTKRAFGKAPVKKAVSKTGEALTGQAALAKELGATATHMKAGIGRKPITTNIKYLQDNFPNEFKTVTDKFTVVGKHEAAVELLENTGRSLKAFAENSGLTVPVKDVVESKAFTALNSQLKNTRISPNKRKALSKIKKDFLDTLAANVLDEKELKLYNAGKLHKTPGSKILSSTGEPVRKAVKTHATNEDALIDLLKTRELPIDDAVGMKIIRDEQVNWSSLNKKSRQRITTEKHTANSLRQAIETTVKQAAEEGVEGSQKYLDDIDLFHKFAPVADVIDTGQSKTAGVVPKLSRVLWSQIASPPRAALQLVQKAADFGPLRTALRQLAQKSELEMVSGQPGLAKLAASLVKETGTAGARAATRERSAEVLRKMFDAQPEPVPTPFGAGPFDPIGDPSTPSPTPEALQGLQAMQTNAPQPEPQTMKFPRDSEAIFSQKEMFLDALGQKGIQTGTDPVIVGELVESLSQAFESSNTETIRTVLLDVADRFPDLFRKSSLNSLFDDMIFNKYDKQIYERELQELEEQGQISVDFLALQRSELNKVGPSRMFARPEPGDPGVDSFHTPPERATRRLLIDRLLHGKESPIIAPSIFGPARVDPY